MLGPRVPLLEPRYEPEGQILIEEKLHQVPLTQEVWSSAPDPRRTPERPGCPPAPVLENPSGSPPVESVILCNLSPAGGGAGLQQKATALRLVVV
jgi:hypothetical protein